MAPLTTIGSLYEDGIGDHQYDQPVIVQVATAEIELGVARPVFALETGRAEPEE